jgi:hypothetical protein
VKRVVEVGYQIQINSENQIREMDINVTITCMREAAEMSMNVTKAQAFDFVFPLQSYYLEHLKMIQHMGKVFHGQQNVTRMRKSTSLDKCISQLFVISFIIVIKFYNFSKRKE